MFVLHGMGRLVFNEDKTANNVNRPTKKDNDDFLGVPTLDELVEIEEIDDFDYFPLPSEETLAPLS